MSFRRRTEHPCSCPAGPLMLAMGLILLSGCGGAPVPGSGGDALALSTARRVPGQFVTVSHPSIAANSSVEVRFRGNNGYEADVRAMSTESGSVRVAVPPLMDRATGTFHGGETMVSLPGVAAELPLTVEDLPAVSVGPPGVVLELLFEAAMEANDEALDQFLTSALDFPEVDIDELLLGLDEEYFHLEEMWLELIEAGQVTVDLPDGSVVTLSAEQLAVADRLIIAWLSGLQEELGLSPLLAKAQVNGRLETRADDGITVESIRGSIREVSHQTAIAISANGLIIGGVSAFLTVVGLAASAPTAGVAGGLGLLLTVSSSLYSWSANTVAARASESFNTGNRLEFNATQEAGKELVNVGRAALSTVPGPVGTVTTFVNTTEEFVSKAELFKNMRCQDPGDQKQALTLLVMDVFCTEPEPDPEPGPGPGPDPGGTTDPGYRVFIVTDIGPGQLEVLAADTQEVPLCNFAGGGLDCTPMANLEILTDAFPTADEAVRSLCSRAENLKIAPLGIGPIGDIDGVYRYLSGAVYGTLTGCP